MKFPRVRAQAFLSQRDSQLQLTDRGLVGVTGEVVGSSSVTSNGSGKSSLIVEPVCFALYGRTARGIRGEAVINRAIGKNCLVELEFITGRGVEGVIRRPMKHATYEKAEIVIGGERYRGADEVTRLVQELLGVGFETLMSSLVFTTQKAFFTEMTDAGRKKVLEELLGLQDLSRFAEAVKAKKTITEQAIYQGMQAEAAASIRLVELRRHRDSVLAQAAVFDEWRASRRRTLTGERASWEVAQADAEMNRKAAAGQLVTETGTLSLLEAAYTVLLSHAADAQLASTAHRERVVEIERTIAADEKRLRDLRAQGPSCETCMQPIPASHHAMADNLVRNRLNGAMAALGAAQADVRAADAVAAKKAAAAAETERAITLTRQKQYDAQRAATEAARLAAQAVKEISDRDRQLAELDATARPGHDQLAALDQEITDCVQAWTAAKAAIVGHENTQAQLLYWETAFSNAGLKSSLLHGVLPYLDARAAHYSRVLTDSEVQVRFSPTSAIKTGELREKFDVQVDIAGAPGGTYDSASSGQQRRADIITTHALGDLSLARMNESLDLLILDEVFDGLDPAGIERAIQMLNGMTAERGSIFCITHNSELAHYFPTNIHVRHENGVTELVRS